MSRSLKLIALLLLILVVVVTLRTVPDALRLATGLTAKLHCSGHYLSGFDDARNTEDIATYSGITRLLNVQQTANEVTADFAGFYPSTARFYPGLGCTLQYAGTRDLARLRPPEPTPESAPAPGNGPAFDAAWQGRLEALLARDNTEGLGTRALLVQGPGGIIAEAYAEGIDSHTPLLGWSMGKSVSALLIGRLEALGQLRISEDNLFPAWSADERAAITVEQLLQMSSGLDFSEPYVPGNDSTRMLFMQPSAAEVALASPLAHTPGSHFYYSSGTTNLLTRLVSDRLGGDPQTLLDFFDTELAKPLKLANTTFELDASGVFVGSSYIYAPTRDWARLGRLVLDDGRTDERQLLPQGWAARAAAPNGSDNDPRYGYQFWLNGPGESLRWPGLPEDAFAMQGNRGQVVMLLPSHDLVIVRLGWTNGSYPIDQRLGELLGQ